MGMWRRRVSVVGMKARLCSRYGTDHVRCDRKFRYRGSPVLWGLVILCWGVEQFHFRSCLFWNDSFSSDINFSVAHGSRVSMGPRSAWFFYRSRVLFPGSSRYKRSNSLRGSSGHLILTNSHYQKPQEKGKDYASGVSCLLLLKVYNWFCNRWFQRIKSNQFICTLGVRKLWTNS